MSLKRRRTIGAIGLALGLVALMAILILTALHAVGTDDALYHRLQLRAGILPGTGISDADLRDLDGRLAAYLAGDESALYARDTGAVIACAVDGEVRPAFGEREMTHMADCLRLFALLRKVRSRLIPWAVLLIVGGAYLLQDRRRIRRAAWLSPTLLLVPLGAFALWAVVDFDAAFTFFHRVLFTNDLWLLDPRTDLLIRICPQSMFMAMGLRIALWGLAALVGAPAAVTALTLAWPQDKKGRGNAWNDNRAARRAAAQRPRTFDAGERR